MKTKFILLTFLQLFLISLAYSQETIFQSLSGKIIDSGSGTGIAQANVLIKNETFEKGIVTDENGTFTITEIPVGRYNIFVSHIGYAHEVQRDVLLEAGKEKYMAIQLDFSPYELQELTITDEGNFLDNLEKISFYPFSLEQSQRVAATFYDPARMVLSFPGVTSANDEANNISVRGNAPYTNSWRLQGADIVNPNHLTNAGTFSDRPSVVGGGVSILSAQLMDRTQFLTGAFPANYGNALGGIMDIHLREGNTNEAEYTAQVGLLGIDVAAEGPFGKNSDDSYLINYRYSTIGLLQSIGIEVSPEEITFQDLSFHVNLNTKKNSQWGLFGILGLSSEKFESEKDSTQWELIEDRVDTKFSSDMGAIGITNKTILGKRSSLNTVLALSEIQTERNAYYVEEDYQPTLFEQDVYDQGILTLNSVFQTKTKNNHQLSAGIIANHYYFNLFSQSKNDTEEPFTEHVNNKGNYQVFKAFGEWKPIISSKVAGIVGLHALYFDLNDEVSVEPRLGLTYFTNQRSSLSIHYGLISQSHFPQAYFVTTEDNGQLSYPNKDLKLSKSHQVNLSYSYKINALTTMKIEAYYQHHFNVPVSSDIESTFSLLNSVDVFIDEELVNEGTGDNMGLELMIDRAFKNGFYFTLSSSVYDSKYTALDGIERNTRYNGSYANTFTFGKEIQSLKNNKNRIFGANFRLIWQGGYRHTPIDETASEDSGRTEFVDSEAFTLKYNDFFRTDLRIYLKKNKPKYTRTLSLDIQNLTNQENIGYQYYDRFTESVETRYQLGILPVINYRVEF